MYSYVLIKEKNHSRLLPAPRMDLDTCAVEHQGLLHSHLRLKNDLTSNDSCVHAPPLAYVETESLRNKMSTQSNAIHGTTME